MFEYRRKENYKTGSKKQGELPQSVYQTLGLCCGNSELGKAAGSVVKYGGWVQVDEFVRCEKSLGLHYVNVHGMSPRGKYTKSCFAAFSDC